MKIGTWILGAVLCCGAAQAADNLLQNGDFASGDIKPWRCPQAGRKKVHTVVEGKLNVTGDKANKYQSFSLIQQLPQLEPGKTYLLGAKICSRIKTPAGKQMKLMLRQSDSADKTLAYETAFVDLTNRTWHNYAVKVSPDPRAAKFEVYIQTTDFADDDTVFVDDVVFRPAPELKAAPGNAVLNGDFEYFDLSPWQIPNQWKKDNFFTLGTETRFGGQCLMISGDPAHRYNKGLRIVQDLPELKHGQEYVLSARVRAGLKNTAGKKVTIQVRQINAKGATNAYTGFEVNLADDTWKYYEKGFKPNNQSVKFQLYIVAAGLDRDDIVAVDEIKLGQKGDAGSPFDPGAAVTVPVRTLKQDGITADVASDTGLLHQLAFDGVTVQPGAKLSTVAAVEEDGSETLLDGKGTPAAGFKAVARYDFADGMFREVVEFEALEDRADPVKLSIRHGFDPKAWRNHLGALRPIRVTPADQATVFSFRGDPNDLNPGVLELYQHTAYPLVILEGDEFYLLAGSRNLDDFVTLSPNHPAGYIPSLQRNPKTVKKGDKFRFETNWKLFSRKEFMLRDVWRFYQDHLQAVHPNLKPFLPPKYTEKRHFYPGVFGSHTYLMKEREERLPDGASVWFDVHDTIRERYPVSGSWWSAGNAWRFKIEAGKLKAYMERLQTERKFNLIFYLRQLANLHERDRGAFPDDWYLREPGGALHLYGGGYRVQLPKNVAEDVGYDYIPWGHHNFGHPGFRAFYLNEIFTAMNYYRPRAIGWDMGSNLEEFSVMAETYDRLRRAGGKIKVVANESAGPTQAYADMVLLENGLLGGKSAYDFEINRAYTTSVVCLERWNLFDLAYEANINGRRTWLYPRGLAENKRYIDFLYSRRPELKGNKKGTSRLCQLRASIYDLAMGASPGYLEEARPQPSALPRMAGEVNGLFSVNKSFAVMFPNRSNVDGHKIVSAWNDAAKFRLVAFNDQAEPADLTILLDRKFFAGENWTAADLRKHSAQAVSPENETDVNVTLSEEDGFIRLTCKLDGFTALFFGADK